MKEFVISEVKAETAILVGLITKEQDETKTNEYLDELEFLADTAGAVTVKRFTQRMAGPSQVTYVGKGKLEEIRQYIIRKEESKRHAESLHLHWIDGDYDHQNWLHSVNGMEKEPERGKRCECCFRLRLLATAKKAHEIGISHFATTLASSRWKDLEQITRAGYAAQEMVEGTHFWAQNWRKGGLQDRRNELLKEYGFYNQQYCGCEFSMARLKHDFDNS